MTTRPCGLRRAGKNHKRTIPNLNPRNWKERASTIRPADGQQDRDGALTTLTEGQVARSRLQPQKLLEKRMWGDRLAVWTQT